MSLCIVNQFKIIDVTHCYSKEFSALIINDLLNLFFVFVIGRNVSCTCKTIASGNLICCCDGLKMLIFLPYIIITVFNTDNEMRSVGRPADRHSGIFRISSVDYHPVVFDKLLVIFKTRNEIVLIYKQFDAFPVIRIYYFIRISTCDIKEVLAFLLDLQFTIKLMRCKFRVICCLDINIVNKVILSCQALRYLRISNAFFLRPFKFEICFNLFIDILDTYNEVFFISRQHLGVSYILYNIDYDKTV